jgi:hypothetical protein
MTPMKRPLACVALVTPPYGRISAIESNKGEMVWQIAHGETPDNIRDNPALRGLQIPRTGCDGSAGTLVTKTLVIARESGFFTTLPANAARCSVLTTKPPAGKSALSSCLLPKAALR